MILHNYTDFDEFYNIVKSIMNKDVWFLIFEYLKPKFNKNEYCLLHDYRVIFKIKICNAYLNNNKYYYSYRRNNNLVMYVSETNIYKLDKLNLLNKLYKIEINNNIKSK